MDGIYGKVYFWFYNINETQYYQYDNESALKERKENELKQKKKV